LTGQRICAEQNITVLIDELSGGCFMILIYEQLELLSV
jgi:hypothetical protein